MRAPLCLALGLAACAPSADDGLLVLAAASTSNALLEIGRDYAASSGVPVRFSFGGSSELARQISAGAPADLFLSADLATMDGLEGAGLVRAEDRVRLLSNSLVVVAGEGARGGSVRDFDRVACADPAGVPAGLYARAWLTRAGLWHEIAPRLIFTLDVRAALAAVESGATPAAIVYATDAALTKRARVVDRAPRELAPEIVYPAALVKGAHESESRAFLRFLQGTSARALFERYGFVVL